MRLDGAEQGLRSSVASEQFVGTARMALRQDAVAARRCGLGVCGQECGLIVPVARLSEGVGYQATEAEKVRTLAGPDPDPLRMATVLPADATGELARQPPVQSDDRHFRHSAAPPAGAPRLNGD